MFAKLVQKNGTSFPQMEVIFPHFSEDGLCYGFSLRDGANPVEKLIKRIVAAMRSVPSQQEVDIFACILQFECQVHGNRESRVAVASSMPDVPVLCHRGAGIANEIHGIHEPDAICHIASDSCASLLSAVGGEIDAGTSVVAKFFVLARCVLSRNTLRVECWCRFERLC